MTDRAIGSWTRQTADPAALQERNRYRPPVYPLIFHLVLRERIGSALHRRSVAAETLTQRRTRPHHILTGASPTSPILSSGAGFTPSHSRPSAPLSTNAEYDRWHARSRGYICPIAT